LCAERRLHGHHRAGCSPDDLLGHAAQQEPIQSGAAVRAHNDQVSVTLLGDAQDHILGLSLFHPPFDAADVWCLELVKLLAERFEGRFRLRMEDTLGGGDDRWRRNMQDEQMGTVVAGEGTGQPERLFGLLRVIRRVEDRANGEHGLLLNWAGPTPFLQ